ncbi:uncharacterized protein LOC135394724 [Ornithodoros turicata]|uniref:uncharacterized protein LOC135394724 n=1 Tax=Ornithodoros turicata TaxID=34597 RepID=UPI003138708D
MRAACEEARATGNKLAVVQWINIGEELQNWLQICYAGITSQLLINGNVGAKFDVRRSVRQGCPISPTLFALYLEPLCRHIIEDETIQGTKVAQEEIKLLAFADDAAIICTEVTHVERALEIIRHFCEVSGATLNLDKTKGCWLGEWAKKPENLLGIEWTTELDTYLGVKLDPEVWHPGIWKQKLNQLQGKLQPFMGRQLSILHRSVIINTALYPAILYCAQAIPVDGGTVQQFHRLCARYLWQSKFERMRRSNIFWSLEAGGLGVVNLEIKIKVQRFLYFRDQRRPEIRAAMQVMGTSHLLEWIVTTTQTTALDKTTLTFYREMKLSIRFFLEILTWEYLATVKKKKLYWDTVAMMYPPPLYRQNFTEISPRDVLKRIKYLPIPTSSKDFFVKFHIEVLPAKHWLQGKGFLVPWEGRCDMCGETETLRHVVYECRNAFLFWSDLRTSLQIEEELPYEALKFLNFKRKEFTEVKSVAVVTGLQALWKARTSRVECDAKPRSPIHFLKIKLMWTLSLIGTRRLREKKRWKDLADTIQQLSPKTFGCRRRNTCKEKE